jgi:hypothetical protein
MLLFGIFLGILITLLFVYLYSKLMTYFRDKFTATRWYPVACYKSIPEKDGTYQMNFKLSEDGICKGYTKKCPPQGISADDLVVMVRKYHEGRGLYRVFWKLKSEI